jgi:hypothetical protein
MEVTIESIMLSARQTGRELTVSQAESILRRHVQLVKEGRNLNTRRQDEWQDNN